MNRLERISVFSKTLNPILVSVVLIFGLFLLFQLIIYVGDRELFWW